MNPAILSPYASQNWDALNGAQYALLQAQLAAAGEDINKYYFLAPSLCGADRRFKVQEKRKAEWVEFLNIAYAAGVDPATLPDLEGCDTLVYKEIALIGQGVAQSASLIFDPTGLNNSVTFKALAPGAAGNLISIELVKPAGNNAPLGVPVPVGNVLKVNLATDAGGLISTTATALAAAINGSANTNTKILASVTLPDTGAGLVTALAQTFLSGGADVYNP